jgi:tetratricopeptide (TPR) repeat protein
METARQTLSDPAELSAYYHQAARALFENKQCKRAIPIFENAFRMNPSAKQTASSRFRLGRCWLAAKRPEAARQEWLKAVALKDSFWSPLAQSEIALLSP